MEEYASRSSDTEQQTPPQSDHQPHQHIGTTTLRRPVSMGAKNGNDQRAAAGSRGRRAPFVAKIPDKYAGVSPNWLLIAASLFGGQCIMNLVFFTVFCTYSTSRLPYATVLFYNIFLYGSQALLALYCLVWKYVQYQVVRHARNVPGDVRMFFSTFFYIRQNILQRYRIASADAAGKTASRPTNPPIAKDLESPDLAESNGGLEDGNDDLGEGSSRPAKHHQNPSSFSYEPTPMDVPNSASSRGLLLYLRHAHQNHVAAMMLISGSEIVAFAFAILFMIVASRPIYLAVTNSIALTFSVLLCPFVIYSTYLVFCSEPQKTLVV